MPPDLDDSTLDSNVFLGLKFLVPREDPLHPDDPVIMLKLCSILSNVVKGSRWMDQKYKDLATAADFLNDKKNEEIKSCIREAFHSKKFKTVRDLSALRDPATLEGLGTTFTNEDLLRVRKGLESAYKTPFIGDAHQRFLSHLRKLQEDAQRGVSELYAKYIAVIQSSGCGKSRMISELGKQTFVFPMCFRATSPISEAGYPPPDKFVDDYMKELKTSNDWSISTHLRLATFIGAAYTVSLQYLKRFLGERSGVLDVLRSWNTFMASADREKLFEEVVKLATDLANKDSSSLELSPQRKSDTFPESLPKIVPVQEFYESHVELPLNNLMGWLSDHGLGEVCITSFDEAHNMGIKLWMVLRLMGCQPPTSKMWIVSMGTNSSIDALSPAPDRLASAKLRSELATLPPPYFVLGFDKAASEDKVFGPKTIGELRSVQQLSKYGRPLWDALYKNLPKPDDQLIPTGMMKLLSHTSFDPTSKYHVLAVLSPRLGIDTALHAEKSLILTDRMITEHMRIMDGISTKPRAIHSHSPSEPVISLAAARYMYDRLSLLSQCLELFNTSLYSAGLIDKGTTGELVARLLILLGKDFAIPDRPLSTADFTKPTQFMAVLRTLFGSKDVDRDPSLFEGIQNVYVNFHHWDLLKVHLPEELDRNYLAGLWVRGVALQCSFTQESLDLFIVAYHGETEDQSRFDPDKLSGILIQVKFKDGADLQAADKLRPIGIPQDARHLPYIVMLIELGTSTTFQVNKNAKFTKLLNPHLKVTTPDPDLDLGELQENFAKAQYAYEEAKIVTDREKKKKQGQEQGKKKAKPNKPAGTAVDSAFKEREEARLKLDQFNRYEFQARGTAVYEVLETAGVKEAFLKLLHPLPVPESDELHQTTFPVARPKPSMNVTNGPRLYWDWLPNLTEEMMDVD